MFIGFLVRMTSIAKRFQPLAQGGEGYVGNRANHNFNRAGYKLNRKAVVTFSPTLPRPATLGK
jgi:hypothetical protein